MAGGIPAAATGAAAAFFATLDPPLGGISNYCEAQ